MLIHARRTTTRLVNSDGHAAQSLKEVDEGEVLRLRGGAAFDAGHAAVDEGGAGVPPRHRLREQQVRVGREELAPELVPLLYAKHVLYVCLVFSRFRK